MILTEAVLDRLAGVIKDLPPNPHKPGDKVVVYDEARDALLAAVYVSDAAGVKHGDAWIKVEGSDEEALTWARLLGSTKLEAIVRFSGLLAERKETLTRETEKAEEEFERASLALYAVKVKFRDHSRTAVKLASHVAASRPETFEAHDEKDVELISRIFAGYSGMSEEERRKLCAQILAERAKSKTESSQASATEATS